MVIKYIYKNLDRSSSVLGILIIELVRLIGNMLKQWIRGDKEENYIYSTYIIRDKENILIIIVFF